MAIKITMWDVGYGVIMGTRRGRHPILSRFTSLL
jgi:hypothetical protein